MAHSGCAETQTSHVRSPRLITLSEEARSLIRVLVITPFYAPDFGSPADHYAMQCEDLAALGCEVSVICAVPHYPTGKVHKDFRRHLIQREQRNGVDVTRVWVPSVNRARLGLRFLSFLCFQLLAAAVAITRRCDALIFSGPALEVFLPFAALRLRRIPSIYVVHEIYPDIGVKLGIFRNRHMIACLDWMERFCCEHAAYVRVLSEGYKLALQAKGWPSHKLAIVANWADTEFIVPLPPSKGLAAKWELSHSFVVMYAGNVGLTQGLEQVIEAARVLRTEPSIRFVIVGDGAAKESLRREVQDSNLSNVQFIPFQPRELLPFVMATANVSLVPLKKSFAADSVPSKVYSILASGRPLIAITEENSDMRRLMEQAECGFAVEPGDTRQLVEAIRALHRDRALCARLGANGRAYVVRFHSRQAAARKFQELLLLSTRNAA